MYCSAFPHAPIVQALLALRLLRDRYPYGHSNLHFVGGCVPGGAGGGGGRGRQVLEMHAWTAVARPPTPSGPIEDHVSSWQAGLDSSSLQPDRDLLWR